MCGQTPPACGGARVAWLGAGGAVFAQPGCSAALRRAAVIPTATRRPWIHLLQLLGMRWAGGCRSALGERTRYAGQG